MPRRVILLTGYSMYGVLTFPQEQSHLEDKAGPVLALASLTRNSNSVLPSWPIFPNLHVFDNGSPSRGTPLGSPIIASPILKI
jgi:hypothetical protein